MRITGTQYSLSKKQGILELTYQGRSVDKFEYIGKTVREMTDEIWRSLKLKGTVVNKDNLQATIQELFPNIRRHGPLK
ncbi:hypothetical protein EU537_11005 [Candidatus Thorarchaeota archaeon]|nr:MAG: hypothetical protein EU537_11005 [Candidatus Thorarchaeota archaeon]